MVWRAMPLLQPVTATTSITSKRIGMSGRSPWPARGEVASRPGDRDLDEHERPVVNRDDPGEFAASGVDDLVPLAGEDRLAQLGRGALGGFDIHFASPVCFGTSRDRAGHRAEGAEARGSGWLSCLVAAT